MSHYIIMLILVLIIYAILMYLYIHTFYYLKKAEQTGCFNSKVNLKYMQIFQMIEIIAITLSVLFVPYLSKTKRRSNISIVILMALVVLCINAYMAINVYQFYNEMTNCPIMNTWNKWWLYWEGIAATISSVRGILVLGLLIIILGKAK